MTKVLVTGVGGGVGQSILKSLADTPYRVIGADAEPLAAGLYAAPRAYQIPYASTAEYVDRLLEICRTEACSLLFPGLDAELPVLAREADQFKSAGVTPVVSSRRVIDICDDKLATYRFLSDRGFAAPLTLELSSEVVQHLSFPMVLKPRRAGARSKGVYVVADTTELSYRLSTVDCSNYVAQEYLDGDEYTCGSVTFDGHCFGTIILRRLLRDGDTYKAFVLLDEALDQYLREVAEALQPFGPCNFQLRIRDGKPHIFEINARCSGTTHCRALAGFNEPLMVADYVIQGKPPSFKVRELSILRYWQELVVENGRVEALQQTGVLTGDGSRL